MKESNIFPCQARGVLAAITLSKEEGVFCDSEQSLVLNINYSLIKTQLMAKNAQRTIYLADLPKNITYIELSEFFEQNIGPCKITIKR